MNQTITSERKITYALRKCWKQTTVSEEFTLHRLAPYIGKLKSSIASCIILNFTRPGQTIYDPYSGSGTIPLEAYSLNRNIIANDLNPYAYVLTVAKLNPPRSLDEVLKKLDKYHLEVEASKNDVDLRKVPSWVRKFFHNDTLRETITWVKKLKESREWFLLACLLGILHHQRPGFLSFPSSHTVPYLRLRNFPKSDYPELYEYRDVVSRLEKKVKRAFKRMPKVNKNLQAVCTNVDALTNSPKVKVDAIITSPPYMRNLDYGRDNRLRLWFLGCNGWQSLDKTVSPTEKDFLSSIRIALNNWRNVLTPSGKCILILGDTFSPSYKMDLPSAIIKIAINEVGGYGLIFKMRNLIPNKRRVRRNHRGNMGLADRTIKRNLRTMLSNFIP